MIEIDYQPPEPGNDVYSRTFWRQSASRRERIFVMLGVSEPYFHNGRWLERYSPWNPVTWLVYFVSIVINAVMSMAVSAAVTTHMIFLAHRRTPRADIRRLADAPEGKEQASGIGD